MVKPKKSKAEQEFEAILKSQQANRAKVGAAVGVFRPKPKKVPAGTTRRFKQQKTYAKRKKKAKARRTSRRPARRGR